MQFEVEEGEIVIAHLGHHDNPARDSKAALSALIDPKGSKESQ